MTAAPTAMHERAMLFSLKITCWSGGAKDYGATKELLDSKSASHGAASVTKSLLPGNDRLKAIKKIAGLARNFNYEQTLPWSQDGDRVLPSKRYNDHTRELTNLKHQWEHEVNAFISEYQAAILEAKRELGDLFNAADYPTESVLRSKFSWGMDYKPIPSTDDFRITLSTSQMKDIKAKLKQRLDRELRETNKNLYVRLYKLVNHMAETLGDPDQKFKDSLTGNIERLTKILPDLNITGDAELQRLANEAEALTDQPPQVLRDDSDTREDKAKDAKKLADDIQQKLAAFTQ